MKATSMPNPNWKPARNTLIACAVSALLGILGGFFGRDLSPIAKPATDLAIEGADAIEKAAARASLEKSVKDKQDKPK